MRGVFVYPTETCYGLGVDATNLRAVKKLYRIKGRSFKKPVHIVVSSRRMAKEYVVWNSLAEKLARAFWPGSLTLVLPVKKHNASMKLLSAGTGFLGVRMPKHKIPLQIVKKLGKPITATSANVSGKGECYSLSAVEEQFKKININLIYL
jgi:L-threonylcarbamoyladenylate synthase